MKDNNLFRRVLRRVLQVLSLSATAFIFQACYGVVEDYGDVRVEVSVHHNHSPIKGIQIEVREGNETEVQYREQTYEDGKFTFYYLLNDTDYTFSFYDVDGPENGGLFKTKELTQHIKGDRNNRKFLDVELELEEAE
jgi:hypothetical protein